MSAHLCSKFCSNLGVAIERDCLSCVKYYIPKVLNWHDYFPNRKENILHKSVSSVSILKLLLPKTKKYIDSKNDFGQTPLNTICRSFRNGAKCCPSDKLLIENGASVDIKDDQNRSPLHRAVIGNCLNCVKFILDLSKMSINDMDDFSRYPLYDAVENKNSEMIKLLVEHGAKSFQNDYTRNVLFASIIFELDDDIIKHLIDNADIININLNDGEDENILHLVACYKKEYILETLPKDVIFENINKKNEDGQTPLFLAVVGPIRTTLSLTKKFLELGALIDIRDKKSRTALEHLDNIYGDHNIDEILQIKELLRNWQDLPSF